MYLTLDNHVTIYQTKGDYNVIVEKVDANERKQFDYFTINKTGKQILESIDGLQQMDEFIQSFILDNNLVNDDSAWIQEFLIDMLNRGALLLQEEQKLEQPPLYIYGDSKLISPLHVTVEITEKCNLYCAHCYLNASCNKTTAINFHEFEELVKKLKANNVLSIEITGGEVFMNRDADKILELAFNEFSRVALLTNGTILKKSSLELLTKNKDKLAVSISLDSVREDLHDRFRGMRGAFKSTCRNIKRLTESGIHVRVASSIFDENMWEVDKLAELAISLGAEMFVYNFVENFGRGTELNKNSGPNFSKKYSKYLSETVEKYRYLIPIIESEDYLRSSSNCGAGTNTILIGADGNLRPCPIFPKNKIFKNINDGDMVEIFSNEIYQQISNIYPPSIENGCPKACPNYSNCFGCYMKGLESNVYRESENYCPWITFNNLESFMEKYKEGKIIEE
ncbi:radical SAM/SPASM domain-containing protein [Streptococcus sp. H31]|uniref:radical SAM protein n=1 Tax=Streptococcus huangxiaojuni TaxID=3237239 RepID=UPI0034A3F334